MSVCLRVGRCVCLRVCVCVWVRCSVCACEQGRDMCLVGGRTPLDAFSSTRDGTARSGIFYGPFAGPFGSFVAQVGKSEVRLGFGPSVDYSPDGSVRGPVHPRPKDGRPSGMGRVGTVRSLGGDPRTPGWLRKRPRPSSAQGWTRC